MAHVVLNTEKLQQIMNDAPGRVGEIVQKMAQDVEAIAKNDMSRTAPLPSQPGSPPAVQTGNLKNSIVARRVHENEWRVLVGAEYGIYLEYGAPSQNLKPRPFMQPAIEKMVRTAPPDLMKVVR